MITDADGLLTARFAALRDDLDDADWSDVLRRRGARMTRRTRRLVVALAVFAAAVPSALAFGGVRGFFFGSPAPPLIQKAFAGQNAMRKMMLQWSRKHHKPIVAMPEVNGRKAHSVLAVNTSDGPLVVWVAPTATARQCWFIGFADDLVGRRNALGGGSCDGPHGTGKIVWGDEWSALHPTLKVLSGRLYVAGATSVTVVSPSGTFHVPVAHRFFLAALPKATKTPTKLIAQDPKGHWLATWTRPR